MQVLGGGPLYSSLRLTLPFSHILVAFKILLFHSDDIGNHFEALFIMNPPSIELLFGSLETEREYQDFEYFIPELNEGRTMAVDEWKSPSSILTWLPRSRMPQVPGVCKLICKERLIPHFVFPFSFSLSTCPHTDTCVKFLKS